MKKYIAVATLLAAGSAFANAATGTAVFDFKASDLGGETELASVTLNDALTEFDATIAALSGNLVGGDWNNYNASVNTGTIPTAGTPEYDFIKGATKSASLTLTFGNLVAGSLYDITLVTGVPFEGAGTWNALTTENTYTSSSLTLGAENIEVKGITTYQVLGVTANEVGQITFKINNKGSHSASFNYASITGAVIPEPSAFGLLAGLGALALVGTRRRRK